MPGIWGAVGYTPAVCATLRTKFEDPWGDCDAVTLPGGVLGGHAFHPYRSVHTQPDGVAFALDGYVSAYSTHDRPMEQQRAVWELHGLELSLNAAYNGNLALAEPKSGLWFLAADWSGIFPLYYLASDTGLAFCSRQRPIAEVFELTRDPLGLLEFLRYGYTFAGRTLFRNLRRLLPGQVLSYNPLTKKLGLRETSKAWTGARAENQRPDEVADRCWHALLNAVKKSVPAEMRHAVMTSGGWDSRTLLAAAALQTPRPQLLGYSHGDLTGRELQIARKLCHLASVPFKAQAIDDATFDLNDLQYGFARTENVFFPHWHRAGAVLSELGIDCVSAGVYGEVLGGHYGVAMLLPGPAKANAVGRMLLGLPTRNDGTKGSVELVATLLRVKELRKAWYLSDEFWRSIDSPTEALNGDIEIELRRLFARGVVKPDKLVEAFISENRGTQYITSQLLSCRARLNIAVPFADPDFMREASQAPIEMKIHNKLNRRMLQRHAREYLRLPCSATLLPASMPILLQEASRVVRYILATGQWKLHLMSRGIVSAPRLSWINFEFLRSGKSLFPIAEEIRSPICDKTIIADRVRKLTRRNFAEPSNHVHSLASQMMIIYTADLMAR